MNFKFPEIFTTGFGLRKRRAKEGCTDNASVGVVQSKDPVENCDLPCSRMKRLFGFCIDDFKRWSNFVQLMNQPMDPSSLGILRIMFGFIMMIDAIDERGMAYANERWGNSNECRFPLFNFLQPLPIEWMYMVYLVQITGAFGIMTGLFYRTSCLMFIIPYWYIFLLEKTHWNNHSYLFGLFGLIFLFTDANRYCSLDGLFKKSIRNSNVPLWNYFLFRTQIFIVYFIAGIKKLDSDWLSGYSMRSLSGHWVFSPFGLILSKEQVDFWIVHQGGLIIDLFIGFVLFFDFTRCLGLIFGSMFHLMNSFIFPIGMFPYVMLGTLPLFCSPDWPKKLFASAPSCLHPIFPSAVEAQKSSKVFYAPTEDCIRHKEQEVPNSDICKKTAKQATKGVTFSQHVASVSSLMYITFQLFLPFSHFLTPGYNNWTNGLYGYSWDMMVYNWNIQHIKIKYVNKNNGETGFLNPGIWTMKNERWSSYSDTLKQLAMCINKQLTEKYSMNNTELYFDIWKSLNNRFNQRLVDPRVNLVKAEWKPFESSFWILPLLKDLSDWRTELRQLERSIRNSSNNTDVTFIADFPGLHLENFIQSDLHDVEIQVLTGSVVIEIPETDARNNVTLSTGEKIKVPSGQFHKVYTVSEYPSCYMYTFLNKTQESLGNSSTATQDDENQNELPYSENLFKRTYKEVFYVYQMTKIALLSIVTGESFESIQKRSLAKDEHLCSRI